MRRLRVASHGLVPEGSLQAVEATLQLWGDDGMDFDELAADISVGPLGRETEKGAERVPGSVGGGERASRAWAPVACPDAAVPPLLDALRVTVAHVPSGRWW